MNQQEQKKTNLENNTEAKRTPWVRLASAYYQNDLGEHPSLADEAMYSLDPVLDPLIEEHLEEYNLPIIPCLDGHNVMTIDGAPKFLETEVKIPLSPNFVRDLAGRVIYIGYGPEIKRQEQWTNDRHVTFPRNCRVVTSDIEGSEYIENIFFTRFRSLDTSLQYENIAHQKLFSYEHENLYPYKLRLDTFYQDGWRLPQTNMVYARKSVDPNQARSIGVKFLEEWEKFASHTSYEDFIEQHGGKNWLEKLFKAGCTVIPTKEAFNHCYIIDDEYKILGYRNGRAVEGLHSVVSEKASEEPRGTILEVIEPGFVTSTFIHPAKVIVSDGKRFEAEQRAFVQPTHPDLRLPHQRTQYIWGATWLPTHPNHFIEPAIWGWDMATGHFLQFTGPLWDPLHYYYECTPLVIKAFRNPEEGHKNIAYVPKEMKNRFYPASAIKGFDMMSYNVKKMREEHNIFPKSGLLRISDNVFSSTIGYHPLPLSFEYELAPMTFPEFMPEGRLSSKPMQIITTPVIECYLHPEHYIENASDMNEHERLRMPNICVNPTKDALQNYPQLHRYLSPIDTQTVNTYGKVLFNLPKEKIESIYQENSLNEIIEATGMSFYKAVQVFHKRSLNALNDISREYHGEYVNFILKYWKGR